MRRARASASIVRFRADGDAQGRETTPKARRAATPTRVWERRQPARVRPEAVARERETPFRKIVAEERARDRPRTVGSAWGTNRLKSAAATARRGRAAALSAALRAAMREAKSKTPSSRRLYAARPTGTVARRGDRPERRERSAASVARPGASAPKGARSRSGWNEKGMPSFQTTSEAEIAEKLVSAGGGRMKASASGTTTTPASRTPARTRGGLRGTSRRRRRASRPPPTRTARRRRSRPRLAWSHHEETIQNEAERAGTWRSGARAASRQGTSRSAASATRAAGSALNGVTSRPWPKGVIVRRALPP